MPSSSFPPSVDSATAPALECFAFTPDDTGILPSLTKAIYVGTGGDIVLRSARGEADVTFRNIPSGYILDVRVAAIRATGTTADDIVGLA